VDVVDLPNSEEIALALESKRIKVLAG